MNPHYLFKSSDNSDAFNILCQGNYLKVSILIKQMALCCRILKDKRFNHQNTKDTKEYRKSLIVMALCLKALVVKNKGS